MTTENTTRRRAYGSGSIITHDGADGSVYYGKFRDADGRQVKKRIGPARTPHRPDGLTKTQAEARLRDLIQTVEACTPVEMARTLSAALDAWEQHRTAAGAKQSSTRAARIALNKWFIPGLGDRSLDRITSADIERAMTKMRAADLSDKTILNYVGAIRALFNFARDRPRRWTRHNPVDDVTLPAKPVYTDIRYLTHEEAWALLDAVQAGPYRDLDRALYLTAIQTGLRIGELQALDWRSIDLVHARIRVRRSWDRKTKTFTKPKTKRSERSVPLSDEVAGELERMFRSYHPDAVEPDADDLVFGDPFKGEPLGHRAMYERLRSSLKQAGVDEAFAFHNLRHTFGTRLAAQGVPMRTLQEWMGHKDITTTQRYADYCPNPQEREIVEAAFARGTNLGTNLPETQRN